MMNAKEWRKLLEKHPDNKSLKKWLNRVNLAEKQRKAKGVPDGFTKAWALYGKYGDKQKSIDAWNDKVLDPELVTACIPRYLAECKKSDISIKMFQLWIEGERWERYEEIKDKVEQRKLCKICKSNPPTGKVKYKGVQHGHEYAFECDACDDCMVYEGQVYDLANKKWTDKATPAEGITSATDMKGNDTTMPSCSQDSGAGSLSAPLKTILGTDITEAQAKLMDNFRS
jgi:hypothetical protein